MKANSKEQARARQFLSRYKIKPEEVKQFECLTRPHWGEREASIEANYGPGLVHIETTDGRCITCKMHKRDHPSSLINTLLSMGKPCANMQPAEPSTGEQRHERFSRPSLYMFWYFIVFLMSLIMVLWSITSLNGIVAAGIAVAFGAFCLYALFLLQTHFCFITLEADTMEVHSVGRTIRFPYERIRKVNFDFARELNSTHVMELLEQIGEGEEASMRHHLYYIGRVPRTRLNDLAEKLQQQGIDASCSLNDQKRHYHDTMHLQHN